MNKHNKNNWEIDWENFGKENEKERTEKELKNIKSGSISFIKDIDKWTKWEVFHAHWEAYLTPHDYWKNWQEKINSFQTKKEVNFYTNRLRSFMEFVEKCTLKDINVHCGRVIEGEQQRDSEKTPQLIAQELKRLENISEEEFNKTDKWRSSGLEWKELSVEEMLNDPWFNKQLSLEKEPTPPQKCAFCSKTIDPLQCVWTNKEYFCDASCMTNWNKKSVNEDSNSKNHSSTNQKTSGRISESLIWGSVGFAFLLGLLVVVVKKFCW